MYEEEFEENEKQAQSEVEKHRLAIANRIALRSEELIDALFDLAAHAEDDKVRLSAISQLLDRGIPKLGVQHTKADAIEESTGRKGLREEIEALIMNEE